MFFISVATTYCFAPLTLKLSTKNWENRRNLVITSRRCYTIPIFLSLAFPLCHVHVSTPNLKQIGQKTQPHWPKTPQNRRFNVITSRRRYYFVLSVDGDGLKVGLLAMGLIANGFELLLVENIEWSKSCHKWFKTSHLKTITGNRKTPKIDAVTT